MKKFSMIIASLMAFFLGSISLKDYLDNRPFKFENYKTSEEFKNALYNEFPVGTNVDNIVNILNKSNAICAVYDPRTWSYKDLDPDRIDFIMCCSYKTGFLSFSPFREYSLDLVVDKERKLVSLTAYRSPILQGFLVI